MTVPGKPRKIGSSSPWSKTWYGIRQRCTDRNSISYPRYGGRGIKNLITKDELKALWIRDKGHLLIRPSIDRIDPDGHYEFSNCRYIELSDNAKRRRVPKLCPRGHDVSNFHVKKLKSGYTNRICRICMRISRRQYRSANPEKRREIHKYKVRGTSTAACGYDSPKGYETNPSWGNVTCQKCLYWHTNEAGVCYANKNGTLAKARRELGS